MRSGHVVDQRFRIEQLAGLGGMGAVYRAHDLRTGVSVALKVLVRASHEDELRFEREALAIADIDHPGIVRYVTHGITADGQQYLAMEWIEGEDLAARLSRGPLSPAETVELGMRLAGALGAAHARGVVHRDLKPGNILLAGNALEHAKIVDFGLATFPEALRATLTGTLVGTPAYMAPEQARDTRVIDPRADVFALGCVLYECLLGKPAFQGKHVMAILAKLIFEQVPLLRDLGLVVPTALDLLIAHMMAKDPAKRPANGRTLVTAFTLIEALAGETAASSTRLGLDEQRFACIVLAEAPEELTGVAEAAPLALASVEARGGRPVVLADGTIAVIVQGPGTATDHAALAARYALALRDALPGWAIAVTTGRVQVSADRAVGDAIERAADRIRARGEATGSPSIDLDDVTAGLLDQRFEVTAGRLGIELSREHEIASAARTLLGRPTAFVGRDREMALLQTIFAECVEEPAARAVLVTAPAGIGKSRLRQELIESRRAQGGVPVWIARGDPMRDGAPFGMIAALIRGECHLSDGEPIEARRQKILARVSRHVASSERLRVAEFLGEMAGTRFPDEGRVQLRAARQDPQLLGDQMRRAWIDLLDAETVGQPLVLVLEDLHWGDQPSADHVDAALRMLRDRPLFVLALARPEVHDRLPNLWRERRVQEVRLLGLPRRACDQLIRDALGEGASAETMARLWERSAGNAFFLEELLRATVEGRGGALPETMQAMIQSRLDTLDAEDRLIMRAASIFGEVFWDGGLGALLGGAPDLGDRLARLVSAEWIVRRPAARFRDQKEYLFRHGLVREVAYEMLTEEDRALGHRLAGEWLEAAGEGDAIVLAEHHERGSETRKAIRWYTIAAERARAQHAHRDAERLYDKLLDEQLGAIRAERVVAYRGRGLARYPMGRHQDALDDLRRARELAVGEGDVSTQIEILLDEGIVLDWMSDYETSKLRVEEAHRLLPEVSSALLEARVLLGLGRSAHRFSRTEEAADLLSAAAVAADVLGEPGYETLVISLLMLGFILQTLGQVDDARLTLDRVIGLCESHGDGAHLAAALSNRAILWSLLGDRERMHADMDRALDLGRSLGLHAMELAVVFNLGEILLLMNDPGAAEPHIQRAAELDPGRALVELLRARLHMARSEDEAAAAIVARIRARQDREDPLAAMVPSEDVLCTAIELCARDADEEAWDALVQRSERFSVGQEHIEVLEMRARAGLRRGRREEARRYLSQAREAAARIPNAMSARLRALGDELADREPER